MPSWTCTCLRWTARNWGELIKKADPALASLPLIMLTSLAERGEAARLKQIGFAACLTKPLRQSQIQRAIAGVLMGPDNRPAAAEHRSRLWRGGGRSLAAGDSGFSWRRIISPTNGLRWRSWSGWAIGPTPWPTAPRPS